MTTKEEAKDYIKTHAEDYLTRARDKKSFICPICGSGSGDKGTGITTKDHIHFTCWAGGCFKNADIIDINMGCPAPKVTKNGEGSKILLDLELAEKIMKRWIK